MMGHKHDATNPIKNWNVSEQAPDSGARASSDQTPSSYGGDSVTPVQEATVSGTADAPSPAIAELQSENLILKDRLLRALAETENVRRRTERDLNDARQYAIAKFAGDLLPVVDNLQRAISNIPAEWDRKPGPLGTLIEGIELTKKELVRVLERHGVSKQSPVGERFDPHVHEALFEVVDATVPDGTVSKVMEPGYTIGTRPLRPAKVGVARGGPSKPRSAE